MSIKFCAVIHDDKVEISLQQKEGIFRRIRVIPVEEWNNFLPEDQHSILAVTDCLVDDFNGFKSATTITLPHDAVVGLTATQADLLGLPPPLPFAFDIRANGTIDQPSFFLTTRWVTPGGTPEYINRKGAFAIKGQSTYRIPSPIFEIINAAEILSGQAHDKEKRYQALAALYELLPKDEQNNRIKVDSFLGSIRVLHASSFSFQIPTDGVSFQFNPVLFSRKSANRAEDEGRILDEAENLLTPNLQHIFAEKRFKHWNDVRDCYTVDNGVYVYLDPDLKKTLSVVRKMQNSSSAERKAFIRSPQRVIREHLGEGIAADTVERLFVETEQYANNVIGLGIWQPPIIPWLKKEPNSWLPEKFGLQIGNSYVQIRPEDVGRIRDEITAKLYEESNNRPTEPYVYEAENGTVEIPIKKETVDALSDLIGIARIVRDENLNNKPTSGQKEELQELAKSFLIVEDNINETQVTVVTSKRAENTNANYPVVLKSSLKSHQIAGFKWLINSWTQGAPGILLADDMGLGKTLQALTFLAWLKERKYEGHKRCTEPVLIIAPTGLLNNWQKEIKTHLHEPYLGKNDICKAYGKHLAGIRETKKNDLDNGHVNLNRDSLRSYDVVLTTYETYRDYHHSFAGIKFAAAVLDECQKIKNPKSQVNRALASLNAEFVITMTGTPIENAMEDLWTILDRAWPGFLGDLKSFSSVYAPDNREALQRLTVKLKNAASDEISTPILFRRMKEDILHDLPKKLIHTEYATMPPEQADAYLQIISKAKDQEPPPMLFTLHALRGVSLHPIDPGKILREGNYVSYDKYIKGSARLIKAIEIMDYIHKTAEKVLIFIETIDMQSLMADIIKKRYSLKNRPGIINGKTGVDKIQRLVDDFQCDKNFDVMILSPKVGGVGLTLTAANHVIHLSRWWNPAVEDQSTDRVYRIGQTKEVHVYYPMSIHPDTHVREHSFDLKLNALLEKKRQLSRDMLIPAEDPKDTENLFNDTVGFSTDATDIRNDEIDRMDPEDFEKWVLNRAGQQGYNAERTLRAWDYGADGIITNKGTGEKFIL